MLIKTPVKISDHARINMSKRRITKEEVFEVLLNPEKTYTSKDDRVFVRGDLAVVVHEERNYSVVKTVLLAEESQWSDETARRRR